MSNKISQAYVAVRNLSESAYTGMKTDLARVPVGIFATTAGAAGVAKILDLTKDSILAAPDAVREAAKISTELAVTQTGLSVLKGVAGLGSAALVGGVTAAQAHGAIRSFGKCANACA